MVRFERIPIGDGGGLVCASCRASEQESFTPAHEVLELITRVRDLPRSGSFNCLLEGAEPFRHPSLPALIAGCASGGAERIALVTDAGALAIPENAAGSLEAGLRQIHVPLFGAAPESHDRLCRSGSFEKTSAGVGRFLEAGERAGTPVLLVGVIPVCEHTIAAAPHIVATFARLGAVTVRMILGDHRFAGHPAINAAFETGMVNGVWVWVDAVPAQGALDVPTARAPMIISEACE